MGDSSGSMFYGVIGFLVVYFVGYFICRVYDKIKKILRSHSSKSQRKRDDNVWRPIDIGILIVVAILLCWHCVRRSVITRERAADAADAPVEAAFLRQR